ncbi:MAG: hypothetical protein ACTHKV_14880 [Flavipsychrobacter sp.]
MKNFKDLGITIESKTMSGEKIKIERILNTDIIVHEYKIENSKFEGKGNGKCLYLQITYQKEKRVVFSGSGNLMEQIQKVKPTDFPFSTKIIKDNDALYFT